MVPFAPLSDATVSLTGATSTGSVHLGGPPFTEDFPVRVYNSGSAIAFIRFGTGSVTAALTDLPIPPGALEVLTVLNAVDAPVTHVAAITGSSTAKVYFTTGRGTALPPSTAGQSIGLLLALTKAF